MFFFATLLFIILLSWVLEKCILLCFLFVAFCCCYFCWICYLFDKDLSIIAKLLVLRHCLVFTFFWFFGISVSNNWVENVRIITETLLLHSLHPPNHLPHFHNNCISHSIAIAQRSLQSIASASNPSPVHSIAVAMWWFIGVTRKLHFPTTCHPCVYVCVTHTHSTLTHCIYKHY